MSIRLGDTAPDFEADTTQGKIKFHDWLGSSWGILFSHPKDFTPVCTTELGYMARLKPEFDKRNTKIIGLSVDPVGNHEKWAKDIEETQGAKVIYPLVGDPEVKATLTYPMSTGRNFDEVLRLLDSCQLTAKHTVATPVNWKKGEDVIIPPSVSDDQAKQKYPKGWKTLKPYLRIIPQPQD